MLLIIIVLLTILVIGCEKKIDNKANLVVENNSNNGNFVKIFLNNPEDIQIVFERGRCFGPCPVFFCWCPRFVSQFFLGW